MQTNRSTWLISHPVFTSMARHPIESRILVAYVEAFAPVVNSVPAFLHLTLSRADGKAGVLLRDIWNDELGLSGTKAHPVLFDELHRSVVERWGRDIESQRFGVSAAVQMIQLCGSGPWPIGVAAMKAHESQFPTAYASILPTIEKELGDVSEFFKVHSVADVEHSKAGDEMLAWGIAERVVTGNEADEAYSGSTAILHNLMDSILKVARP